MLSGHLFAKNNAATINKLVQIIFNELDISELALFLFVSIEP
tara:strand:+ start:442 stop:567 length:126 start_codon:yes stop_codon:yes gene_type:complete